MQEALRCSFNLQPPTSYCPSTDRSSRYESRRTVIETRRWDPFSGTIAAAIGVSADLAKSAADTVVKPVKTYQQRNTLDRERDLEPGDSPGGTALQNLDAKRAKSSRGCISTTKSVSAVSAQSMSKFLKHFLNGLVIIPFAFTEGFRSVPLLYGEELRDYGEIYDWKSGIAFGAKAVVFCVVDGVGGLFILPYEGAKKQGVFGAVKGVGKGVAGLTSRVFTGMQSISVLRYHDSNQDNLQRPSVRPPTHCRGFIRAYGVSPIPGLVGLSKTLGWLKASTWRTRAVKWASVTRLSWTRLTP